MKAVLCSRFGGPDDLEIKDIPPPLAGPGEAIVAVRAAALNFFDTLLIAGKYQHKPPFPFSPASEFAGVVESVGAGATGFAPGDRVMGWMGSPLIRDNGPDSKLARAFGKDLKGQLSIVLYVAGIALSLWRSWLAVTIYVLVAIMWIIPDRRIEK